MSKRPSPREKLFRWRISRIRSTPAVEIETVEAPDADSAIKEAIEHYQITNRVHQERLVARRLK
jgi:hypothetical protein